MYNRQSDSKEYTGLTTVRVMRVINTEDHPRCRSADPAAAAAAAAVDYRADDDVTAKQLSSW